MAAAAPGSEEDTSGWGDFGWEPLDTSNPPPSAAQSKRPQSSATSMTGTASKQEMLQKRREERRQRQQAAREKRSTAMSLKPSGLGAVKTTFDWELFTTVFYSACTFMCQEELWQIIYTLHKWELMIIIFDMIWSNLDYLYVTTDLEVIYIHVCVPPGFVVPDGMTTNWPGKLNSFLQLRSNV